MASRAEGSLTRLSRWARRSLTPVRLAWYLSALLLPQVVLFLVLETTSGVLDRQQRVRGRDFIAFYVYGDILLREDSGRVYDPVYFQEIQETFATVDNVRGRPVHHPLYPPTTGLLFVVMALPDYGTAIVLWWLALAGCFALAFALLLKTLDPAPEWRRTALLSFAAFVPVSSTFWNGQLAGLLLLVLVVGLALHRHQRPFLAGLVLSLLALKPQLVAGLGLWLLLRLDVRTLVGMAVGGVIQGGLACLLLGPHLFVLYRESWPLFLSLAQKESITPDHQHSLGGILTNLIGGPHANACKLVHLTVTLVCAVLLFRIVRANRGRSSALREQAAAVLFGVFAAPHLHTYDMVLLLVPIVHLFALANRSSAPGAAQQEPGAPEEVAIGGLLYLSACLTFVYAWIGFSLAPVMMILALAWLAAHPRTEAAG